MSLYERYELLDLNRDIGVKTFEAREIATGRPVKVHLFVRPSAPLQAALLKAIDKLSGEERQRIIERGKHEGTPYVVTDRLIDYAGLSEWLQAVAHSAKQDKPLLETAGAWKVSAAALPEMPAAPAACVPAPSSTAAVNVRSVPEPVIPTIPPPAAHSELNQKFTELFATAERPVVADSLLQAPPESARNVTAPLRPPEADPPAAAAPVQGATEPGEFTRMFQSPLARPPAPHPPPAPAARSPQPQTFPAPPAPRAVTPPPAKTSPPAAKEAGEFTRMFQAPAGQRTVPVPSSPAPSPAPVSARSGPGEFTRFFETPLPAGPLPQSPAVQQPLSTQGQGRSGFNPVSEFTRTFGKPGSEAPPPPAVAPQQEPGEFTRMFHSPVVGGLVPASPTGPVGSPAAQPPSAAPQAAAQPLPPAMGGAPRGFSIPAPTPPAPQPAGPGDYTRQFSAPAQLTFGQNSATPSAPATAPSPQAFAPPAMAQPALPNMATGPTPARKSNLPLILGVIGIVIVAVLLIVFFALRPK